MSHPNNQHTQTQNPTVNDNKLHPDNQRTQRQNPTMNAIPIML